MSGFEWKSVLDAAEVGIIVLDEDFSVRGWNDWIARTSNTPASSALGKNLLDLFPSLAATRIPLVIAEVFQSGSSSILTHSLNELFSLRGDTGQPILQNLVVRPIQSGTATYCLIQINDVTTAVTRERVLRDRQNARYHAIVDSAPDAIITTSTDWTIQWSNTAAERVFGYTAPELLSQKLGTLLVHPDWLTTVLSSDEGKPIPSLTMVGRRKDGAVRNFEISFAHWTADNRAFVTTIWRDVTERMTTERALRESEMRHRALADALPQLVWTCDRRGECDFVNPQWQSYTGASSDDSRDLGWLTLIHDEERPMANTAWHNAVSNQEVFDIDARLRRYDGSYRWFKMRSIPVKDDVGDVSKWFGTATDITALVEAQQTLKRSNEELETLVYERTKEREVVLAQLHESQKMETIGQLTGGVAHDFNNLLAVILGSLSLLRKALPDDPRTSRLLDGAIQGAERGATLTKRLLAFARRQELRLEAVELQKVLPDMLGFLQQSIGPAVRIILDLPADVSPVKIDSNQLELALMNLAVNARDAMPNGGTLTISARDQSIHRDNIASKLAQGDYVKVSVTDTGEGMSAETLTKATEPFFTTKGVGKGTGLGLSMIHGLTVQSGGAMEIKSQPGRGTTVSLWLPRARAGEFVTPEAETGPARAETLRQLRILLVDDDSLVSKNAVYMISDLGHSVSEASSAAQAIQMLSTGEKFDVVITDYAMPGMNGLDLASRIRQMSPGLPIILATGFADFQSPAEIEFPRLGKPYSQDELAKTLEAALEPQASPR